MDRKQFIYLVQHEQYLYPSSKFLKYGKTSQVDFWNPDSKLYPHFNKTKYIEIKLSRSIIYHSSLLVVLLSIY